MSLLHATGPYFYWAACTVLLTWLILSISWDPPLELFVPEARGGASSCSRDELGTRSLNRTALNSTVLTKLQIPENGEKMNPSPISNHLAQLPWDN